GDLLVGTAAEADLDRTPCGAPYHLQTGGLARLPRQNGLAATDSAPHRPPVEGHDPVAHAQVGARRGTALGDAGDDRAVAPGRLRGGDAEVGAVDLPVGEQPWHYLLDDVDRDGEPDAARLARGRG